MTGVGGAGMLWRDEVLRLSGAVTTRLVGCSSPPKVCILGAGARSGRRGAMGGTDSRWRRSSSSLSCSFIFLLALLPELLRSASGSVDLERRKNPSEDLREAASRLFTLRRLLLSPTEGRASGGGGGGGGWLLPGVRGRTAAMVERGAFLFGVRDLRQQQHPRQPTIHTLCVTTAIAQHGQGFLFVQCDDANDTLATDTGTADTGYLQLI